MSTLRTRLAALSSRLLELAEEVEALSSEAVEREREQRKGSGARRFDGRHKWTEEELAVIRGAALEGRSLSDIAKAAGHPKRERAVQSQIWRVLGRDAYRTWRMRTG